MKDIRCMLGRHKFSEWIEVGKHLERECLRCTKVEAKYPDFLTSIADLILRYHIWKNTPRNFIYPHHTAAFCEKGDLNE